LILNSFCFLIFFNYFNPASFFQRAAISLPSEIIFLGAELLVALEA